MTIGHKHVIGCCCILGLGLIAEFIYFQRKLSATNVGLAWQESRDPATHWFDAQYLSPVGTKAAPRMYVSPEQGNELAIQGGDASVTNSTGRWAA